MKDMIRLAVDAEHALTDRKHFAPMEQLIQFHMRIK